MIAYNEGQVDLHAMINVRVPVDDEEWNMVMKSD